jgi:O-antigen ligase
LVLRRAALGLLFAIALTTSAIGVANVLLAIALALWAVVHWKDERRLAALRHPAFLALGAFVAVLVLSAVFSLHPAQSLFALKGLFTFLLFPLFADGIETVGSARAVGFTVAAAALAQATLGLWQYAHGGDDLAHRIHATLSHYMTFSGILLLASLFCLGVAFEGGRGRVAAAAIAMALASVLLLTFTRNAYVGFFVAIGVYLAARRPRAAWLAPAAAVAAYAFSPAGIRARLLSTFDPSDPTNRDRIDMAVAGLRMIRDFPVFGLGLTLVKPYYPLYRVPGSLRFRVPHLHDNLLQIGAESGLFAAAAYVAFVVAVAVRCVGLLRREEDPARRGIAAGALLALVGITAAGFFEYNFGDVEVLMTTLVLVSLPFSRAFGASRARA